MPLPELLDRLAILLRSEQRRVAAAHGLQVVQLEVLRYLTACNRYSDTPGAVTEYLGATPGTVSQTLQVLERRGLVEKHPDPADARRVHCRLTEEGRTLLAALQPTPAIEQQAEDTLRGLLTALQRARGGRTFGECGTCRHHLRSRAGSRCGLTGEALTEDDAGRICVEHAPD